MFLFSQKQGKKSTGSIRNLFFGISAGYKFAVLFLKALLFKYTGKFFFLHIGL